MKCPACKTENWNNTQCVNCGFSLQIPCFLNEEDATEWFNRVVIPFRNSIKAKEEKTNKDGFIPNFSSQYNSKQWQDNYLTVINRIKENPVDSKDRLQKMAFCYEIMLDENMEFNNSNGIINEKLLCAGEIIKDSSFFLRDISTPQEFLFQQYAVFMIGFAYIVSGKYKKAIETYRWFINCSLIKKEILCYLENGCENHDYFSSDLVVGAIRNICSLYAFMGQNDEADIFLYSNSQIISTYISQQKRIASHLLSKGNSSAAEYCEKMMRKFVSKTDTLYLYSLETLEADSISGGGWNKEAKSILDAKISDGNLLSESADLRIAYAITSSEENSMELIEADNANPKIYMKYIRE